MLPRSIAAAMSVIAWLYGPALNLSAAELRYRWQSQQKFAYNISITVEESDTTTTFQGITHYEVVSANAEQLKVMYRGGLREQAKLKPSARATAPFGPRGFGTLGLGGPRGLGGFPSPFSRPSFAGKVQTTNQIIMTPTGRVLGMEGDSHLPFLLGNVSLLPFETLPKTEQKQWVVDSGVSISEENESDRPGYGPRSYFGPFGAPSDPSHKHVQAATEVTRYSIEGQKDNLVSIRKSYQLTTPAAEDESFDMSGGGVWVFDTEECIPHSLDLSAKLIAREGNSSTTFPISIKIQRVSASELANMEAEAKRTAEEAQRQAAEAKALAEKPLTADEKKSILKSLNGSDQSSWLLTLGALEAKSPRESDSEIVLAITKLVTHHEPKVAEAAQKALVKWSPEFKRKFELNKAYAGPGPVASSDLEVESTTPLYVGQIIQFQESGSFWFAGRIKQLLPNNKVQVDVLAWGKPNRELVLARRNLQLAHPEVDQPTAPPAPLATTNHSVQIDSPVRTWTDKSGRFKIEAAFVAEENGTIKLLRKDGKHAVVPMDKLSTADQEFVRQLLDENPFSVDP